MTTIDHASTDVQKPTHTPAEQTREHVRNARRSALAILRHLDLARSTMTAPSPEDETTAADDARAMLDVLDAMGAGLRLVASLPERPADDARAVLALANAAEPAKGARRTVEHGALASVYGWRMAIAEPLWAAQDGAASVPDDGARSTVLLMCIDVARKRLANV